MAATVTVHFMQKLCHWDPKLQISIRQFSITVFMKGDFFSSMLWSANALILISVSLFHWEEGSHQLDTWDAPLWPPGLVSFLSCRILSHSMSIGKFAVSLVWTLWWVLSYFSCIWPPFCFLRLTESISTRGLLCLTCLLAWWKWLKHWFDHP